MTTMLLWSDGAAAGRSGRRWCVGFDDNDAGLATTTTTGAAGVVHPLLDLSGEVHEAGLDAVTGHGRRFEEGRAVLVGQVAAHVLRYLALAVEVALVAHQHLADLARCVLLETSHPVTARTQQSA